MKTRDQQHAESFKHECSYRRLLSVFYTLFFITALQPGLLSAAESSNEQRQIVAMDTSPELRKSLLKALDDRGKDYQPRTEHLLSDGSPRYVNRLIQEDSPYLIQHAHNPVNWYPWGKEAFAAAKREDKPVFLSIGYATCHWCHVMERESFESERIADVLNQHYIAIKVDREQRPDVDSTYMTAVQMISGSGGWPMSSWLSSEGKPFYGGTYYPPGDFFTVLTRVNELWNDERDTLLEQADQLSAAIAESNQLRGEVSEVSNREVTNALTHLLSVHDDLQGGFSPAPKFPQESILFLLLEEARRTGDGAILNAAHFSLQQMSAGGIHDHVGGGFHRYSVDNEWLVPHFEKMLYNQAALSRNYLLAYQLTGDPEHARTARRTLDYVRREMTSAGGGFYSATDADSEGHEGRFFVWTPDELVDVLGEKDAQLAMSSWTVSKDGNFDGRNILHLQGNLQSVANDQQMTYTELVNNLDQFSDKLLAARRLRVPPLLDDKIITEWNGMMITAFAQAADVFNDSSYLDTAIQSAEFIQEKNKQADGSLWRAHFDGNSSIDASQTDYAFLAEAMLALFDVTNEQRWLDQAIELTQSMQEQFWDTEHGAYFIGPQLVGGAELPARPKDLYDNATPSGNAVALRVLTRLWHRTGKDEYRELAEKLLSAFSPLLSNYPSSFSYLLTAASELLSGETGARQYAARGKVRIEANRKSADELDVQISIAPGWHINAVQPLQEYLVGTQLTHAGGSALENLNYPDAKRQHLGFERSELALYDGKISINATLPELSPTDGRSIIPLSLQLQACSDKVCLAPETVTLNLSVAQEG